MNYSNSPADVAVARACLVSDFSQSRLHKILHSTMKVTFKSRRCIEGWALYAVEVERSEILWKVIEYEMGTILYVFFKNIPKILATPSGNLRLHQ
jgi:hypothetical protein